MRQDQLSKLNNPNGEVLRIEFGARVTRNARRGQVRDIFKSPRAPMTMKVKAVEAFEIHH